MRNILLAFERKQMVKTHKTHNRSRNKMYRVSHEVTNFYLKIFYNYLYVNMMLKLSNKDLIYNSYLDKII